jgi:16S rRNA (adenine1518-N6/adenine1519-N6)-dimethyltransferase
VSSTGGRCEPRPTKVVANLPYGVAATVLLKSIAELPAPAWVAMVQREVGERLAAAPGAKSYGATSVLASSRARCGAAQVPAHGLPPEPNVDSALVVLAAPAPAPSAELVALVHAGVRAPAQGARRLAGAVAGSGRGHPRGRARRARGARSSGGRAGGALPPQDWPRLAEKLGRERLADLRPR